MSFYLDTSVVVPLFVEQVASDTVESWVLAAEGRLLVSDLTASEFASALSRMVRKNDLTLEIVQAILITFAEWRRSETNPIENLPTDIRLAGMLVRRPVPRLLTPDAIHIATCKRLGVTLVTADADLQACAEREGVAWEMPGRIG